jgi:AraC-like DNA-binding protein
MSFYQQEIERLKKSLYSHDDLTRQVVRAKSYIDRNFSDNINLDTIAAKAHVSKFHFIRVFKKYYGRTPNQYLQEIRIESAKKFLQKGKKIDDVCSSVGFSSKTSFISLFKRLTGLTPAAYQHKKAILKNR